MAKRFVFMGAGAVGSYVGGLIAGAGADVTLIDPWPDHINAIRANGLSIGGTQGEHHATPKALHLHEVQTLLNSPADVAILCTKSYDTEWATTLIRDYLAPNGYVVSLQNGINEERIAAIVGWGRTVGCVVGGIGVMLMEPGRVVRTQSPGGPGATVFKVGEPHGRETSRVRELVDLFSVVDSAKPTSNLWGERWSKLVVNSMGNPVSAISGLNGRETAADPITRRIITRLAGEGVAVGEALGYSIEPIRGLDAARWKAGLGGEGLEDLELALAQAAERWTGEEALTSTHQDVVKGRRTEVDFMNGLIADKGQEVGVPTPANDAIVTVMKEIERGATAPAVENLARIG